MNDFLDIPDDYNAASKRFSRSMLKQSLHLLRSSSVVYVLMTVSGLWLMHYGEVDIVKSVHLSTLKPSVLVYATTLLVLIGFAIGYLFESFFPSYKRMKHLFLVTLGPCSVWAAFCLALLSGIGEEVLFRGGIQPYLGLAATSLIFGLIHLGPRGQLNTWSLAAGVLGLLLGYVYQQTESLLPGIISHTLINFISISSLHFEYVRKFSPKPEHFETHKTPTGEL